MSKASACWWSGWASPAWPALFFWRSSGARVAVSDAKTEEQLPQEIPLLLDHGISVETGHHGERTFRDQDLIVISPGVPFDVPQLVQARALGIPVIGEVELAARYLKGKIVAITGSNGKTTTTALAGADYCCGWARGAGRGQHRNSSDQLRRDRHR